ncbi:hypothetical protein NECAME_11742 [Necator americanus]|uniref:PPM-type phosphatase domain-containing protein n=1 Tax=Necator americanus TaxID=51031 RepID=W2T2Y0_NECAM|nr:hypothetical protein NECAME_11742 [Necator americanus]ETN76360.1 hypothetical protein NECAME_11742 [Necator americanus]
MKIVFSRKNPGGLDIAVILLRTHLQFMRDDMRSEVLLGSCSSLIGPNAHESTPSSRGADRFDWNQFDEKRAFGASVSLYEKNPITGVNAGEPVADVWGIVGRNNNGMRDMRDAGGALGPVDGRNPQLHNLTCSMTFVEEGDVVFITSDGVSDNFDPVVGKFCVIKRTETDNKENSQIPPRDNRKLSVSTKDSPSREFARPRPCAASLPCVDAASRHELMLVRMRDIIANGLDPPKEETCCSRKNRGHAGEVGSC